MRTKGPSGAVATMLGERGGHVGRSARDRKGRDRRIVGGAPRMAAGHRGAFLAALSVAALGQIVAFLALLAGALPGASAGQAARYGWALFYAFHHVGVAFACPDLRLPAGAEQVLAWSAGYAVDAVVAFALLSGTALAAWMLMRAGRSIGGAVGGPELRRGIHGAKVAVPYAILSWIPSWGLSVRLRLPDASPLSVHPSHLAAFFWPLALGAAFGALGGIRSSAPASGPHRGCGRRRPGPGGGAVR